MLSHIIDQKDNERETWSFSLEIGTDEANSRFCLFLYTFQVRDNASAPWRTARSWELEVNPDPHPAVPPKILLAAKRDLRAKSDLLLNHLDR
jgi:hypothetical protein